MAIFHMDIRSIKRSTGQQATGAAAYRAGERIRDERTGDVHNHSRRKDVRHTEIVLPSKLEASTATWARDRARLWNTAEAVEKRRDSRVAREYQVSLPPELTPEQRLALARSFSRELADRYGVAVDLAVHDPKPGRESQNFHAHMLTTTREVTPIGLGAKTGLDMHGVARAQKGLASHSEEYSTLRERWATLTNQALREANIEARVDHRSLAAQGIDRKPLLHVPLEFYQLERNGMPKEAAERLREDYRARLSAYRDRAAEPKTAEAKTAEPTTAEPKAVEPKTAEPKTTEPRTVEPRPLEPTSAEPRSTEPRSAEPRSAEPRSAEPKSTESKSAEPQIAQRPTAQPTTAGQVISRAAPREQAQRAAEPDATAVAPGSKTIAPAAKTVAPGPKTVAPRNSEEIRRRAVQAWLRMRSKEGESTSDASNDAAVSRGTDEGRDR